MQRSFLSRSGKRPLVDEGVLEQSKPKLRVEHEPYALIDHGLVEGPLANRMRHSGAIAGRAG